MSNFWAKLKKPILALAPMEEVTDSAFRQIIVKRGRPDILFTWFISVEGLNSPGRDRLTKDLYYDECERPIVAQIFGTNPDNYYQAAKLLKSLRFDGVDINMGCPDKRIIKQGSCSALIDKPDLAKEIIAATKAGAGNLPISIKTRLGAKSNTINSWIKTLIEAGPAAITLHGRTAREMSKVPNNWEEIGRVAKIVKDSNKDIIFLGNGDLKDLSEGLSKVKQYNLDGVMFGRAIFGHPWFFSNQKKSDLPLSTILKTLLEHTRLFTELHPHRNFAIMRKHFASYIEGFPHAKDLRIKLLQTNNLKEVEEIIKPLL